MQNSETRSPYVNPLIRAAMNSANDRQRTSFTLRGRSAAKRAATWAKNNPTRFINAVARYGVVIVNCYTRTREDAPATPFNLIGEFTPPARTRESHPLAIARAAQIDAQL